MKKPFLFFLFLLFVIFLSSFQNKAQVETDSPIIEKFLKPEIVSIHSMKTGGDTARLIDRIFIELNTLNFGEDVAPEKLIMFVNDHPIEEILPKVNPGKNQLIYNLRKEKNERNILWELLYRPSKDYQEVYITVGTKDGKLAKATQNNFTFQFYF